MADTYLITGGLGCIGAWTMYHLHQDNKQIVCFDVSDDRHRLDYLLSAEEQEAITFVQGDLRDPEQVNSAFDAYGITHVIHLAALQVPMCKANPVLGSEVNITGTVNIFEAARQTDVKHLSAASSIAVYGNADEYPPGAVKEDAPKLPHTLYGVFKVTNEKTGEIYYQDHGISSTMLRPYTVYGVGRDQGLTSEPTKAMLAAAKDEDYHIGFGGNMQFHFASDVARQFIVASEQPLDGAFAFNLGTSAVAVEDVAEIISDVAPNVNITVGDMLLPFPEEHDAAGLYANFEAVFETPLEDGVGQTIEAFKQLIRKGIV